MKSYQLSILLVFIFFLSCRIKPVVRFDKLPDRPIPQISRELRGVWVTRFNWAHSNPDTMKLRITEFMQQIAADNFNAVFFQVRGQAETLYPSPLEPWSKLVGARDPGFDPVALAIREARKHGLKFYAYINLLPLWNEESPPSAPDHLYFKHGPKVALQNSWLCFGEDGKPMRRNEYFYMNPALPAVKTYLKKVIHHFVSKYDIDGLHFDRIRYPGPNYLHDPFTLKYFRADSLRSPITKDEWARRQLTDLVEDVVAEALLIKPYLVNSAATWGLFHTVDMPDYAHFNSGYHQYYQDAIDWLDRGILDFIVPMIYWDIPDPLPNFDDLWLDFKKRTPNYRYVFPGVRVRPNLLANGETVSQINFVRQNGGFGTVMFDYRALRGEGHKIVQEIIHLGKVKLPANLKRNKAEQVVSLDLRNQLKNSTSERILVSFAGGRSKQLDSTGRFGAILTRRPQRLLLKTDRAKIDLDTRWWQTPYDYAVQTDSTVTRTQPWVEFRRMPADTTAQSEFHLLCKTAYPARAWINGDSVKVYRTGIFFDKIKLAPGANRVRARIVTADSREAIYEREFFYRKTDQMRQPFPLWIDEKSVEPSMDLTLVPTERVRLEFKGSRGQRALAQVQPGNLKLNLSRRDFSDYSLYQAELPLRILKTSQKHTITFILRSMPASRRQEKLLLPLTSTIQVREPDELPLLKTTQAHSILYHSLGSVRLGPPIIAEYPAGVLLQANGKFGRRYRIRLDSNQEGYIHQDSVEELPSASVRPSYFLQSLFCAPDTGFDRVRIPYPQPLPYAVHPQPEQKRIVVSLYGVKTSSTWVTHRRNRRLIERVTWRQAAPETYQVIVHLKSAKIWGYELKPEGASLILRVKYPPVLSRADSVRTLSGLKVAIEAGHGGSSLGAIGLSGVLEKDINLDLAQKLAAILQEKGAQILQVRERDETVFLSAKHSAVENSDAHLLVSLHANSGGLGGGYLRVGGTSTYYHNPFWAKFAEIVYEHLLELDLAEFGVVGSFNYRVTRISSRPAILVEQAFLSHAGDEEKLTDDAFRQQMAVKIGDGIREYVDFMMEK